MVRAHLEQVFASKAFAGGKRAQDFLRLLVEHALAGQLDALRERMIGVEMFGRPIDYDTANDAVVRVKATEVRRRLAQYYQSLVDAPCVRIELPVGTYVPQFAWEAEKLPPLAAKNAIPAEPPAKTDPQRGSSSSAFRLALPVVLALITLAAVACFLILRRFVPNQKPSSQIRLIAILPFVNLSGDPGQDYLSDGMTEELDNELGQLASLRVISRTSTATYRSTKKTLPEIARELRVDDIVEGSVTREADRVRVTVQLIDSASDQRIWSRSYERGVTSVLQLEGELAHAIADQIKVKLTSREEAHLKGAQPLSREAVEFYLQGTQSMSRGDPRTARDFLRQAVALEAGYATAHSALAWANGWMGDAGWMPYAEAYAQQRAEALKAIALDDSNPDPHLQLGFVALRREWSWATAAREFQRARGAGSQWSKRPLGIRHDTGRDGPDP